jgi:hypothetical protein
MIIAVPNQNSPAKTNPAPRVPVERPEFFRIDQIQKDPSDRLNPSTDFRPRWWGIGQTK